MACLAPTPATFLPSVLPRTQEVRKWIPPKTRASAISETAPEKLENERVPGRDSEVTVKEVLSPNLEARMNAAEPLIAACAEGYSGKAGEPGLKKSSHGSHVGSASAGVRPSRIAAIGRQKLYRYLESQQAMTASAMLTFNKANKWTFSWNDSPRSVEIWAATRPQVSGVLLCQKSASSD